jgi:hypothetical protein
MKTKYPKKRVEDWLNLVDYTFKGYMPTKEALMFVNFIKEVNGGEEENETPIVHLVMMDNVFNEDKRCAILCHRGIGKTTLFAEYLILFIAAFGKFPGFGSVNLLLYVTDSIENGVKNLRRNIEFRYQESEFLQKLIPNQKIGVGTDGAGYVNTDQYEEQVAGGRKFTDIRLEFKNNKGHTTIVKGYGAKALSLNALLYTDTGITTIGKCKVGDKIFGADGKLTTITEKSQVFNKPMYKITLIDNREIIVSEDHINSIVHKENVNNKVKYTKKNLYTSELLELPLLHTRTRKRKKGKSYISNESLLFIENCKPIEYTFKTLPIDPYVLGLLLGDGSMKKDGSNVLHGHKNDMEFYYQYIPYTLGSKYVDKRNNNVVSTSIKGISKLIKELNINVHGNYKFIPNSYLKGSINQRLELLKGLMDTDGTVSDNGRCSFTSNSEQLTDNLCELVRSLGGTATKHSMNKAFRVEIWINYNPFKLPRKAQKYTNRLKNLVAIKSIVKVDDEPSQCIAVDNEERQFVTGGYFRTHNTGVRGAKEMGQRPTVAILDDLVSDEDARSDTIIETIENTVYKAVSKALHPKIQKMIWLGTPFNQKDPLYKAVESGAWKVSVFPVCEEFPVPEEEFKGSWEDRFGFDYVLDEYSEARALGKPQNFNQELMLRITDDNSKLILPSSIGWFDKLHILEKGSEYNWYITTDFTTTGSKGSDFSGIAVWAVASNSNWFLVDLSLEKIELNEQYERLFKFVRKYQRFTGNITVGIEIDGQQKAHLHSVKEKMIKDNCYFTLARQKDKNTEGISSGRVNKFERFTNVLHMFQNNKVWFAKELKESSSMEELENELNLVTNEGFGSRHDDGLDLISQMNMMEIFVPSKEQKLKEVNADTFIWEDIPEEKESSGISSYVI